MAASLNAARYWGTPDTGTNPSVVIDEPLASSASVQLGVPSARKMAV